MRLLAENLGIAADNAKKLNSELGGVEQKAGAIIQQSNAPGGNGSGSGDLSHVGGGAGNVNDDLSRRSGVPGPGGPGSGVGVGPGSAGRSGGYHDSGPVIENGRIIGAWVNGKIVPGVGIDKNGSPTDSPRACVKIVSLDGSTVLWSGGDIQGRSSGGAGGGEGASRGSGVGTGGNSRDGAYLPRAPGFPGAVPPGTPLPPSDGSGGGGIGHVITATSTAQTQELVTALNAMPAMFAAALAARIPDLGLEMRRGTFQ